MSSPKVSIIIPTYNYEAYIKDAIESALAQDYEPKEVIVVDDGSTDGTRQIVEAFENVSYIYQDNAGVSAARNRGAKEASGEFLVFLDADDILDSTMVSTLTPTLTTDRAAAIAASRGHYVSSTLEPLPNKGLDDKFVGEITQKQLLMSNRFPTGGAVIRCSAFMMCGGFDESLVSTEDRDLWARLAQDHRIILTADRLITVRAHGNSLSMDAQRAAQHMDAFIRKSRNRASGAKLSAFFWAAVNAYRDCQTAWTLCSEKKHWKALGLMLRSMLRSPIFPRRYVSEPPFFRIRALRIFIKEMVAK